MDIDIYIYLKNLLQIKRLNSRFQDFTVHDVSCLAAIINGLDN